MAEVMKFNDFKEEGSESAAKVSETAKQMGSYQELLQCTSNINMFSCFCLFVLRLLGNTDNRAGTTSWRTATLSFSNSTHPMHPKRNRGTT